MKIFKIEIREYLADIIDVEAESIDDAILKVKEMYRSEKIVLAAEHFISTEISEYVE